MKIAVIIPFRGDPKLLEWTLEGYRQQELGAEHQLDIRVGVDGGEAVSVGGTGISCKGYPRMGAAALRNALVKETAADTEVLIFGNSDARPEPDMVQRHAAAIAGTPAGSMVLGAAPWETPGAPSVWDLLLAETPMVFFYDRLQAGQWYDFRQAWTLNLSVRRADFVAAGGFHEAIRPVYYEDIALAFRMMGKEKKGVLFEPRAKVLHRHPTSLDQYLDREELLGIMSPVLARQCSGAFGVLNGTRDLEALTMANREWVKIDHALHRWIYQRMQEWTQVPAAELSGLSSVRRRQVLESIYQMHVPLKRMAFRLGFLKGMKMAEDSRWQERKAEGLWRVVLQETKPKA
jgi:hypothetical protein